MKIEVVCATLNRDKQLQRMIDSVGGAVEVRIQEESKPRANWERMQELLEASYADGADVTVWLADDCEVLPGCFDAVAAAFEEHFPEFDGAIGLNQVNIPPNKHCTEYGFMALGRVFLEHFFEAEEPVFCPDYWHFYADTELGLFAESQGVFVWAEEAKILHHHPAITKGVQDRTYRVTRQLSAGDKAIWDKRQADGLLWGREWDRV